MPSSNSGLPGKSIHIKQDDKLSSRRLSREISINNTTSSEVYYGGASVAVPFMWESQPGTPRVKFREAQLPPLTPPPSFLFSPANKPIKKPSKPNLLHTLLPKLTMRKSPFPPSPASSSSSSSSSPWSSSHSVPFSPFTPNLRGQLILSSSRSSFDSRINEADGHGSPVSTLCFGFSRGTNARPRGWSASISKVFLRGFT
ncbi:uncharacterized protein LOC132309291 [Cornus florida]|uniref:uncharacterized protein LOC132309291 n=1 Tax=Cornus florida TaxID=4283 RepID=UPI002898A5A3|nr:uncharacterized protein LOC132309291 [Cornus florida]